MDNLVLEIIEGPGAGRQMQLTAPVEVGRDPSVQLVLEDALVSRRHARVIPAGSDAIVEDLGSANGTFVNGQEIHSPTSIKPGDQLLLGVSLFELRSPAQVRERPSAVRAIPPGLARAPQRPDYVPQQLQVGAGGQRAAAASRQPELEAPLDRYTKRKARLAPLAVFALAAITVTLFVTFVVRKSASSAVPPNGQSLACVPADHGHSGPGHFVFIAGACENAGADDVTLPMFKGTSHGKTVWYVVTESSDQADAAARGVSYAPKLANAKGSPGIQVVQMANGQIDFPATVDFSQKRVLKAGPTGFPPSMANPPSVGEAGYSPLIQLPSGVVLNAPQLANDSGMADAIRNFDTTNMKVTYSEFHAFYKGKRIQFISTDASVAVPATIEDATFIKSLGTVPGFGDEGMTTSAMEALVAIVNGPLGKTNPDRQGLSSALLDGGGLSPLDVVHEIPALPLHPDVGSDMYSPIWDIHPAVWTAQAIANGDRQQLRSFDEVVALAKAGFITGLGGKPFGAPGIVVNCPIISIDVP